MKFLYCENCEKKTRHKRSDGFLDKVGLGIKLLFTWGLTPWAYPLRCLECGTTVAESKKLKRQKKGANLIDWFKPALIILFLVLLGLVSLSIV
jgi:hypothetical protein